MIEQKEYLLYVAQARTAPRDPRTGAAVVGITQEYKLDPYRVRDLGGAFAAATVWLSGGHKSSRENGGGSGSAAETLRNRCQPRT